jgi:hypothetical protein
VLAIGALSARDIEDVKIWIASDCEGPNPTARAAGTEGESP